MSYIYNLTDTWNSGATTFAGIKMAVTNTASDANSKLLDLAVTGSTSATFVVTRTGNVGVGTSTPNEAAGYNWLTIDGPSTGGLISLSAATVELFRTQAIAANSVTLATQTAIPLLFSTASTERMRIVSTGNVGIGTSNPLARLDIGGGGAQIRAGSDTGANLALWQNTSGGFEGNLGSFALAFFTGANNARTEKMRIDNSGNVGIGTTSFGTSAAKVIGIANGTAPTTSPAGMGQLYVESGALKYRGSSGTVTTIAAA